MIRQELMDNVEQAMNVLQGALNLDNPQASDLGVLRKRIRLLQILLTWCLSNSKNKMKILLIALNMDSWG